MSPPIAATIPTLEIALAAHLTVEELKKLAFLPAASVV